MKTRGFSLLEVLIVVILITLIMFLVDIWPKGTRELSTRAQCSSHLHGIGAALHIYANDNMNWLPVVGNGKSGFGRGLYDPNSLRWVQKDFAEWDSQATPGGCLYLLVKYAGLAPGDFVCPASKNKQMSLAYASAFCQFRNLPEPRNWTDLNDFPSLDYLSYSYHDVWTAKTTTPGNPALPILADKNPAYDTPDGHRRADLGRTPAPNPDGGWCDPQGRNQRTAMSANHNREVNIVLFLGGSVRQSSTPQVGLHEDNIYSAWASSQNPIADDLRLGRWDASRAAAPADSYLGN